MEFENAFYIGKHISNDNAGSILYALQPLIDVGNKVLYCNKPNKKHQLLPGPAKDNDYDSKEVFPKRSIAGYYIAPTTDYFSKKPSQPYEPPMIDYDKYSLMDSSPPPPPSKPQKKYFEFLEDDNSVLLMAAITVVTILVASCCFRNGKKSANSEVLKISTVGEGWLKIGQIHYNKNMILGKGNGGTCVYKGSLDQRKVAIKRLLNQNCSFAEREVNMLRAKEEHENVIKYYSTEQDSEFFYIALECCDMTLKTLIEETNDDGINSYNLVAKDIMKQAIKGLRHLHLNKIVHRDVKPSNILIARRGGQARVVLSDFGLCKKVTGNTSFSHCTGGLAGTDGWIAPEMINTKDKRMTQAVDIFSMGCVFYYVLCKEHPYGENRIARQLRISTGKFDLSKLKDFENWIEASDLIKRMLKMLPKLRPNAGQVLYHPYFWNAKTTLDFFEAFSNRVEKIKSGDIPGWEMLKTMERKSQITKVLNGSNWQYKICDTVKPDLGIRISNFSKDDNKPCYRTYQGGSVVHLLRAIRNKRTHFRELSVEVQMALGGAIEPPDEYLFYFTNKFPYLLMHTYIALSNFHDHFSEYYQCESDGKSQFIEEHELIKEELENNPPCLQAHVKNVGVPNTKYWNNTPQKTTSSSKFKKSQCDFDNNWRQKGSPKNKLNETRKKKEEFNSKQTSKTKLKVDSLSYAEALKTSSQTFIQKPSVELQESSFIPSIPKDIQTKADISLETNISSCVNDSFCSGINKLHNIKVDEVESIENENTNIKLPKKKKKNRRPKKN